ncbi:MAG: DUF4295 family protein [Melioribacteraceae bacterium]|jgi:hypothetical protein|nr:DUF4295 family protein [Melioribacteraceae bacterium]
MAKQQSFADKAKKKHGSTHVNVKVIRTVKSANGSYKFHEKFVKLDDISKVATLK